MTERAIIWLAGVLPLRCEKEVRPVALGRWEAYELTGRYRYRFCGLLLPWRRRGAE